jgi:hypothetical protein
VSDFCIAIGIFCDFHCFVQNFLASIGLWTVSVGTNDEHSPQANMGCDVLGIGENIVGRISQVFPARH